MAHNIPPLSDPALRAQIARLQTLAIPDGAKRRIALMLMEASTPDRHNLDRQPPGRREAMRSTAAAVKTRFAGVMSRAIAALSTMPAEEFDRLVSLANETNAEED